MHDVVIGAWREGLEKKLSADLAYTETRYRQGFRLIGYEDAVMQLVHILDAYDSIIEELLQDGDDCDCDQCGEDGFSRATLELIEVEIPFVSDTDTTSGDVVSVTNEEIPVKKAAKKK